MKKILFLGVLLISAFSFSQSYKMAIGLKGGYPALGGLNAKKMLTRSTAAEFSIGGYEDGLMLSGIFEIQKPLPEPNGLDWYLGAGPAIGFGVKTVVSANGVIGIDYTFQDFPLNLSLDTGPVIYLIGSNPTSDSPFAWGGGFAIRYALK
jgi:hypothetical protein